MIQKEWCRTVARRFSWCVVLCTMTACYSTVPLQTGRPAAGTTLVVSLNDRGSDSLARLVGPGIVSLRGDVVSSDSAVISLAMSVVTDRRGVETFWTNEVVALRPDYAEMIQERKLSRSRSILAGIGIAVGLFAVSDAIAGYAGVFGSKRPGSGTPR